MSDKTGNINWFHIDASSNSLGRIASHAASLLLGKHRMDFSRNSICSVRVVITNADNIKVTGHKLEQKLYRWHTGYPGSLKERPLSEQLKKDPCVVMRRAVEGMLPKNSLRSGRLQNLLIYRDSNHPHNIPFEIES